MTRRLPRAMLAASVVVPGSPSSRRLAAALVGALVLFAGPAQGGSWFRARSAHFEVFCDRSDADAQRVALRLERFRAAISRLLAVEPPPRETPTVVLAVADGGTFDGLTPRERRREPDDIAGFFVGGSGVDYIVFRLAPPTDDTSDTAFHEYAHVFLNRVLVAQPAWIAEGMAEVLSAWDDGGGEARLGLPRAEHLARLRRGGLHDLREVISASWSSPLYSDPRLNDAFYAQSWALVHRLLVAEHADAPRAFQSYLTGMARGATAEAAFRAAFGRSAAEEQAALSAYVAASAHPVFRVATVEGEVVAVESLAAPPAEIAYRLGDVLLHGGRVDRARRHLRRALAEDSGHARAHEAMAHAAMREGKWEEARGALAAAREAAPDDPVVAFRSADAMVRHASARGEVLGDVELDQVVALLEGALGRAPQLSDAADLLARLRPRPYDHRIALLEGAVAREPDRAELALTLAGLHVKKDDLSAARVVVRNARERTRDDAYRFLCDHYLARLDAATRGTAELRGILVQLDCAPEGALDFVVESDGKRLRLRAPSPTSLFVYEPDGSAIERPFTCGPLNVGVRARFRAGAAGTSQGRAAVDGTLLSLTLQAP